MEHFCQTLRGHFTFPGFYRHVALSVRDWKYRWWGIEVGCYCGQSAAFLGVELFNRKLAVTPRLDLVDIFGSAGGRAKVVADLAPIASVLGEVRQMTSVEASALYRDRTLDFIFLDADHAYESIRADIDAWLPKIRPGGMIAGHDFTLAYPGVIRAVVESFDRFEVWRGELDVETVEQLRGHYPVWAVTL